MNKHTIYEQDNICFINIKMYYFTDDGARVHYELIRY